MAFESGFQAGLNLPYEKDPVTALIESLKSGVQFGQQLANAPLERQLLQAKTIAAQQPKVGTLQQALMDAKQIESVYGKDSQESKIAQDYLNKITQSNAGTSITYDSEGRPRIQIGGASTKSGGGTYLDAQGNIVSDLTTPVKTKAQNALLAEKRLEPFIGTIIQTLPQFQNIFKQGLSNALGYTNALGISDSDLPSQQALGENAILKAAEGTLVSFGLNATTKNVEKMIDIYKPRSGESVGGYARRVQKEVVDLVESQKPAKEALSGGLLVGEKNKPTKEQPEEKVFIFDAKTQRIN